MKKNHSILRFHTDPQFNMTPMIDVVFLLIIFFMLICQFIVQENYKLVVPDDCTTAEITTQLDRNTITVSVFPDPATISQGTTPSPLYAVRSYVFDPGNSAYIQDPDLLISDMTKRIVLQTQNKTDPLVLLRADRNMAYGDVQNTLIALSQAGITKVRLAAFQSQQKK